jgi:hypothetical protein
MVAYLIITPGWGNFKHVSLTRAADNYREGSNIKYLRRYTRSKNNIRIFST